MNYSIQCKTFKLILFLRCIYGEEQFGMSVCANTWYNLNVPKPEIQFALHCVYAAMPKLARQIF